MTAFAGLRGTRASDHLDMIRGVAAVVVLIFHVRYRFFLDYADVSNPTLVDRAWYVATAFGHDAVMVFFVVSGLLVGAAAMQACRTGRWRWSDYATARLVRLYVVLIPGLFLTLFWDQLGLRLFGDNAIYSGIASGYRHDFFSVAARSTPSAFLANLSFLQTLHSPTFGSNDALWSLSFEFWYYAAFPLFALAAVAGRLPARIGYLVAGGVLLLALNAPIRMYFPIWLFGVVVGSLPSSVALSRRPMLWSAVFGAGFLVWLVASHTSAVRAALGDSLWLADTVTGAVFAVWLYALLHDRRASSPHTYGALARSLASMSYTLYIVHLPLLVFMRGAFVHDTPWEVTPATLIAAAGIAAAALAYAYVVARLTEFQTPRVRRVIDRLRHRVAGLPTRMVTQ